MPGYSGTSVIQEVGTNQHSPASALSSYNSFRSRLLGAVDTGAFVDLGVRLGWDHLETGRLKTTANRTAGQTTLPVTGDHPALTDNQVLSFDFGAGMGGPVTVVVNGSHAANVTTINVDALAADVGSGARAGIYDSRVLDTAWTDATGRGVQFAPRIMLGKYTPGLVSGVAYFATDGAVIHTDGNGSYYEPFDTNGVTAVVMIRAQIQLYRWLGDYVAVKNAAVPGSMQIINIGLLPGMDYSELYFSGSGAGGDYLAAIHGDSQATNKNYMVSSNNDLVDAIMTALNGRCAVGLQLSGLGTLWDVIAPNIAQHIQTTYGSFNPLIVIGTGGWAPGGEWGSSQEAAFDANVWPKLVRRYVQDIHAANGGDRTAANWVGMFGTHAYNLPTFHADVCEIYADHVANTNGSVPNLTYHVDTAAWDQMIASAIAFNALVADDQPDVSGVVLVRLPTQPVGQINISGQVAALSLTSDITMPAASLDTVVTAPVLGVSPSLPAGAFTTDDQVVGVALTVPGMLPLGAAIIGGSLVSRLGPPRMLYQ